MGSLFLVRRFLLLSRESMSEESQKFHLWILTLSSYFYPLGIYPLLPTRKGTTLPSVANPNYLKIVGGDERNEDRKW
jgi:hypothetical protein